LTCTYTYDEGIYGQGVVTKTVQIRY